MSACRTDTLRHLKDDASLDQPPALLIETTILRRLLTSPPADGSTLWLTGSKTRFDSPNPGVGIVAGLLVVDCPGINGCISRARKGQTLSGCRANLGAVS